MKIVMKPDRDKWEDLTARPVLKNDDLMKICRDIFAEVRKEGERALKKYTWFFDRVRIENFRVSEDEFKEAESLVDEDLKQAIQMAAANIRAFHTKQLPEECKYVNPYGFSCWQEVRGIEKVGLYVPGGSAPLFSTVLMLAVPAQIAGCRQVVLCTPPDREGKIAPALLWAARYCGVTEVYKVGGVQAIAGMTFGTENIPQVYKIFGPGNQYVTAAKQLAFSYGIAVDMPAGPSEVMIVADGSARPSFVAADLLSQAEHGPDSQVVLLTWKKELPAAVGLELQRQLEMLPRKAIATAALENSKCIVLENAEECMDFVNAYAPEHLILNVTDSRKLGGRVWNAGSVFLGNYAPESAGDYLTGTNHTLPTHAFARSYSGLNVDAFLKKVSFQEISRDGLAYLAPAIRIMAETEGLEAHKRAVEVRLEEEE